MDSIIQEMGEIKVEIQKLDKAVLVATEQRKNEHTEFINVSAENTAAVALLEKAKLVLAKTYKKKEEPHNEAASLFQGSFMQVTMLTKSRMTARQQSLSGNASLGPRPEQLDSYSRKDNTGLGIVGLLEKLAHEIKIESTRLETEEKDAQADYEELNMKSAVTRKAKSQEILDLEEKKAKEQQGIQELSESKGEAEEVLTALKDRLATLEESCNDLLKHYDERKKGRADTLENLKRSQAVLAGATFK